MKSKFYNACNIEGLIYQHSLELKTSGANSKNPNTQYITGSVEVATDDGCLNIVPVHYTYVTQTTSAGKANPTFNVLSDIISGVHKNVMAHGAENATKIKISSSIGLNEFFTERSGKETLVSAKRNEGGFIRIVNEINTDENLRNTFDIDMIITKTTHLEENEDAGMPEKVVLHGWIFDFRKNLLPVDVAVLNPIAMDYFESLGVSENTPVFTRLRGRQISETVKKEIREPSAFNADYVRIIESSRKEFVVTWAQAEPYLWDDDSSILVSELKEALANREVTIAAIKTRADEYKASKSGGAPSNAPSAFAAPSSNNFVF